MRGRQAGSIEMGDAHDEVVLQEICKDPAVNPDTRGCKEFLAQFSTQRVHSRLDSRNPSRNQMSGPHTLIN